MGSRASTRRLHVAETWRPTPTVVACRLDLGGEPFPFEAGQAITLEIAEIEERKQRQRTFSLASSPTEEGHLLVATKRTGSPFKRRLEQSRGEEVGVEGPFGELTLEPERPAVMVTGGIGITPFRSMICSALDRCLATPLVLLYSNRTPEEILFHDELDRWSREAETLTVRHTITRPEESDGEWSGRTGRIDRAMVEEAIEGLDEPLFYLCGPPGLVRGLKELLRDGLGVAERDLRSEEFSGY